MWVLFGVAAMLIAGTADAINTNRKASKMTAGKLQHMLISAKADAKKKEFEEYCRKSHERYQASQERYQENHKQVSQAHSVSQGNL